LKCLRELSVTFSKEPPNPHRSIKSAKKFGNTRETNGEKIEQLNETYKPQTKLGILFFIE
jgi:hypothetical protein